MANCKIFTPITSDVTDELVEVIIDSSGNVVQDVKTLEEYINKHSQQTIEDKTSFYREVLNSIYMDLFGEQLDQNELVEQINIGLQGDKVINVEMDGDTTSSNDFNLDDLKVTKDLSGIFISTNDQSFFQKEFSNKLVQTLFFYGRIYNSGKRYEFNSDNLSLNLSIINLKEELLDDLIEYYNSQKIGTIKKEDLYDIRKNFNEDYYNEVIRKVKRLFTHVLAENDGRWFSRSSFENDAFYKFVMLTNFDNFISNHFNNLITIDKGYFGTHKVPRVGVKYVSNIDLKIAQDWTNDSEDVYSHINQALKLFIESLKQFDSNNIETKSSLTLNNFQNVLRVISEANISSLNWWGIRNNPYSIKDKFDAIMKSKDNELNLIFSKENRGLLGTFYTIYHNFFNSDNPKSLYSIYTSMEGDIEMNDLYSMAVNHINKIAPINYIRTFYNEEEKTWTTEILNSNNLSEKKKNWEDEIITLGTKGINNLSDKVMLEFDSNKQLKTVSIGSDIQGKLVKKSNDDKYKMVYSIKGIPLNKERLFDLFTNSTELRSILRLATNKDIDQTFWNIALSLANEAKLNGLLDLITASAVVAKLGVDSLEEFGFNYKYSQIHNKVKAQYYNLLSTKTENRYMQSDVDMLKPGSILSALNGIELLAATTSVINDDHRKSYVVNADKGKLPKYRLTALMNSDKFLFSNISLEPIFSKNIFHPRKNFDMGSYLKTDFTNNDDSKNVFDMTPTELLYSQFVGDYLALKKEGKAFFQPLNYSDKSNIWVKLINLNASLSNSKSIESSSPTEVRDENFQTMKRMFEIFEQNLISDYSKLYDIYAKYNTKAKKKKEGNLEFFQKWISSLTLNELEPIIQEMLEENPNFKFISELHGSIKGDKITTNPVLVNNIKKYRDRELFDKDIDYQKKLYAYNLSSNRVKFRLHDQDGNKNSLLELKQSVKRDWFDEASGEWINYKLYDKESGAQVFDKLTLENLDNYNLVLNPELDKFFEIDNFVTNHYTAATFGLSQASSSKYWGETKSSEGLRKDAASRTSDMYKRGVIAGATIHTLIKGKKNGIPDNCKIAIIQDNKFPILNVHNDSRDKATVYDGGIFLDPMTAIWEQNSLPGVALSDIHRKPIGYVSLASYLDSMLLKCATFTITNSMMRMSKVGSEVSGENLFRSMSDNHWKDKKNNLLIDVDITNGDPLYFENLYYSDDSLNKWKLESIEKTDNADTYLITKIKLIDGVEQEVVTEEILIDSNYKLWKTLGGAFSMHKTKEGVLVYDENSIIEAVNIANSVVIDGYQPLKNSNINWAANESAVKKGVTNINSLDTVFKLNSDNLDKSTLSYTVVDYDFIGIQMNADHHIDDAEISAPTQVLSALIQKGLSADLAQQIYQDLGQGIIDALKLKGWITSGIEKNPNPANEKEVEAYEKAKTELYKILGKNLLKVYENDDDSGITKSYLSYVKADIESNKLLSEQGKKIPFDDPTIFNKFFNGFNSKITKDVIRQKYAGIGAVLNPSHDIITLFDVDGKTYNYSELTSKFNSKEELNAFLERAKIDASGSNISKVRHGDIIEITGLDGVTNIYRVADYEGYGKHGRYQTIGLSDVRKNRLNPDVKVIIRGDLGRNLRAANVAIETEVGSFDLFDLDSSKISYKLESILKEIADNGRATFHNDLFNTLIQRIDSSKSLTLEKFNSLLDRYLKETKKDVKNDLLGKLRLYVNKIIQEDLDIIENDNLFRAPKELGLEEEFLPISIKNNIPNEMMLGKPWATRFGLKEGDDLSKILEQGEEFFYKRLVDNYRKDLLEKDFDLHFHGMFDNDFYLKVFANEDEIKTFIAENVGNYSVKDVEVVINSKGEKYRVDKKGNTLYPFDEELVTVLTNSQGEELFVLTKEALKLFDDNQIFNQVSISSTGFSNSIIKAFAAKSKLFNVKTKAALKDRTYESYKLSTEEDLKNLAKKQAMSFEMALNFIVSRIPAQSMQSFMNMRIAGFIESETNIVYVPIEQLVYQGSDYDIDKAYILGAGVNKNGVFYSWSPYFSFKSREAFNTSLNIPFPNGKMYSLKKKSESKLKEYVEQLNALKKKHQSTIDSMIARANVIRNDKQRQKQLDSAEKLRLQYENSTEVKELEELINYEAYLEDNNAEFDISDIPHGLNRDGKVINLGEFVNFLNIVQKYDNLVYTGSDLSVVETAINNHTTHKMATKARTEALKNKIYSSMWSIGQSIKNNLLQTSPITMGPARDAATNSVSGKYSDYLSNDNPGTRMIQQAQNSIGKKSIGINATGIKVLSALLSYTHTKLSSGKDILLRHGDKNPVPTGDWLFILNGEYVPFKFTPTLTNINWDAVNRTELELLQRTYTEVPEDVLLTISVLLSASTDNAKELILEKINASPELAGVYIYALIGGIDFKTVADFMTTPEVTAVANYAKSNILYNEDKNKSISSAVTYFTNGITNMQDYIKDFDVFKNILLELNGGKSLDYADSNFPTLVRKANKIWAERNGKGSAVEGRVTNVNIRAFDEDSADLLEEILENTQGKLYRPEIEGTQVERYARALEERLESLKTLNLINIGLLGILQSKSSELTLLGQLLSLNQGVKTKLVDRLNYFANINRNVGSKIPGFDFMRFLTDDKYKAYTIEKYESAKDTFNVLDIINTVPHFKAMTWALTVSEVIPSKLTLRAKLVPELLNKVKDAIPETKLLPKHISAVQHYITEVLANKFLDKLSLEVSGLSSFYINSDLTMAPKNKLSLNFRNTDHRMTFKNWVETSFLDNLKAKYPKNSFVKDLSFGFFRSRVTSNAYTLLKLPINLDRDMNELLYSNYLKDFNSIRFEQSPDNPNLAIGDVMFLYNLIVNKHKPGDFSLTKIFEDYLNTNNKAEMNELNKHLITNFFDFESSFIFGENKLVNGVDYDIRDLAIRFLPNGGSTVIKDDDGKKYEISKEYDFVEKKSFLKFNKEKIKFKGADNTTDLPFLKGDYEIYNKQELREILSDILRLYQNNNLEIKLTCD